MLAAYTLLPVVGVPIPSKNLQGLDSLLILSTFEQPADFCRILRACHRGEQRQGQKNGRYLFHGHTVIVGPLRLEIDQP